MPTEEKIISALKEVFDPEIPVNVVDLGFIYGVNIEGGKVDIEMTLTIPGCPMHAILTKMVEEAVSKVDGVDEVTVNLVFEPRWSVEKITEDGKTKLRELGYNI
ncbi:MAG TPA: DUF59 domain-containing protein [candidate division Zixibacteria bacterium]|nr:DUF59 domain-containing protein [candidate division Zixibacteria bacterium]